MLRATRKVLRFLPASPTGSLEPSGNALGDWYVNRLVIDRQPILLMLSARTLLPILAPARELRTLPARLPDIVGARLRRMGIPRAIVEAEIAAMVPVFVAPTLDRAVVGYLVDFAKSVAVCLPINGWDETTLPFVEARLAKTPCHLGKEWIFPDRAAPELLVARWG